ncbi:MAG: cupredoxin domain-containing protein [Actinomycetota bacterium]
MAFENRIKLMKRGGFPIQWRFILTAFIGLVAFVLSACGTGDASEPATTAETAGPSVVIEDLAFEPETLTVELGNSVTWTWNDGAVTHDVSGDEFQSEVMSEGTFSHRFDEPGTYDYVCTLHPNMTGTIEVTK